MLIIELIYKKSLEEVSKFLEPHRAFLQKYYDQGKFLASGPKNPRDGGIILAFLSREVADEAIKEDPFYQHGIAEYRLIQFEPNKFLKEFEVLLKNVKDR